MGIWTAEMTTPENIWRPQDPIKMIQHEQHMNWNSSKHISTWIPKDTSYTLSFLLLQFQDTF